MWNDCHELTFYFSPADLNAFHLSGRGEDGLVGREDEDSCFARYDRNIAGVADMAIVAKARTFIGEFNSNWGRLVRTTRVRLNTDPSKLSGKKRLVQLTRTLDTRIAWGNTVPRPPGF